eukprot:TRINITY_DN701_c0_g1_i1.p1 TRINITY_DN701_c0_g1~~TRINITY_DN701_c0_g1_i1.p1  ORF type:complete len:286 (-),score=86.50 TRINITY_DN701_c0_g1_i1:45-902(-)
MFEEGFIDFEEDGEQQLTVPASSPTHTPTTTPLLILSSKWFLEESKGELDPTAKNFKKELDVWRSSGDYHYLMGDYESAAPFYSLILEKMTAKHKALRGPILESLAYCKYKQKKWDEALEILKELLDLPNAQKEVHPMYLLGCVYMKLKLFEEAITQFQQCLNLNSNHSPSWYKLGQCYYLLSPKYSNPTLKAIHAYRSFLQSKTLLSRKHPESKQKALLKLETHLKDCATPEMNPPAEPLEPRPITYQDPKKHKIFIEFEEKWFQGDIKIVEELNLKDENPSNL